MARNKVVKDHARAIRFAPKWFLKNNEQVKEGSDLTNPKDELSVLTMDLTGASTHKSMFLNGKVTFSLERRQFEYLYEALYGKKNYFKKYWLK